MKQKIFTNCFLVKIDKHGIPVEVCLGMKKRGFGKGLWNGSGGKPKEKESVENAALREIQEEFGVNRVRLEKKGEIIFALLQEEMNVLMHTFLATKWGGKLKETEEMRPQWFPVGNVPYDEMWESDKEWLPIILSGKKIKAKYTYEHEGGSVKTRDVREVKDFS